VGALADSEHVQISHSSSPCDVTRGGEFQVRRGVPSMKPGQRISSAAELPNLDAGQIFMLCTVL
jgi:hypothetical protein